MHIITVHNEAIVSHKINREIAAFLDEINHCELLQPYTISVYCTGANTELLAAELSLIAQQPLTWHQIMIVSLAFDF